MPEQDQIETRKDIIRRMVQAYEELAVAHGQSADLDINPAVIVRRRGFRLDRQMTEIMDDIQTTVKNLVYAWGLQDWYIRDLIANATYYPEI